MQINLCSIRAFSFFGARKKVRFSSDALSPHLLPSSTSGVSFLFTQATEMYVSRHCMQQLEASHLCVEFQTTLEDSLRDTEFLLHLMTLPATVYKGSIYFFFRRWRRNQIQYVGFGVLWFRTPVIVVVR